MMGDEARNEKGVEIEGEDFQRPMGWVRRTSQQVEYARGAFKKYGKFPQVCAVPLVCAHAYLRDSTKRRYATSTNFTHAIHRQVFIKKSDSKSDDVPRLFTFDAHAIQRGARFAELFESDEIVEDFNEVVELDDERVEEVVSQDLVGKLVGNKWFRGLILGSIIVNAILIGVQTNQDLSQKYAWLFFIFDYTVLGIFVCELMLKWYNGFTIYWKVGWNIFDFFIIVILLLGPTLKFLGSNRNLRILRVLRAFRSLRSVRTLTGLSIVLQTIIKSIPDMSNIALFLVIIMLVLSVLGVFLFGNDFPTYFGNLPSAMFTLFICLTQDGWMGIFDKFKNTNLYMLGALYFILAITVGAFIFANLVVAVVVTNLDKAVKEIKLDKKKREDLLNNTKAHHEDDTGEHNADNDLPITSVGEVLEKTDLSIQKPLHFGDFKYLTAEKFQNYMVLISALEDNLAEYKTIRDDLDKLFLLIKEVNEFDDTDDHDQPASGAVAPETVDFERIGKKGDILSNLLELEQHDLISTRQGSLSDLIKDAARLVPVPTSKTLSQPAHFTSQHSSRDTSKPKSKTHLGDSGTSLKINHDGVSTGTSQSQDRMAPRVGVEEQPTASTRGVITEATVSNAEDRSITPESESISKKPESDSGSIPTEPESGSNPPESWHPSSESLTSETEPRWAVPRHIPKSMPPS
ncbi:cation channel sperm-associated protein 4-like [Lytechinus pictus]|uniref:cation channel sperm-associated protein 4-like n=1 Tax=Lytechinus pictus TaxID=7653 RepID=UPI0030BA089E